MSNGDMAAAVRRSDGALSLMAAGASHHFAALCLIDLRLHRLQESYSRSFGLVARCSRASCLIWLAMTSLSLGMCRLGSRRRRLIITAAVTNLNSPLKLAISTDPVCSKSLEGTAALEGND